MVRSKGKAQKGGGALARAIRTGQAGGPPMHSAGQDALTNILDFKQAAAVSEFTIEDRGLDAGKKASTKNGVKTVFGGESWINVEHRVRSAAVPMGVSLDDDLFIPEDLTVEKVTSMPPKLIRRLMPRRPDWSFDVSSGRQHYREVQAFKQWLEDIRQLIADRGGYPPAFEQNLQVWRQLWRVLERCHVVTLVVDARHPLLHLPPALVYHVMHTLKKPLVLVLNKLDCITPAEAQKWAECLREGVPGIAAVVGYSKESLKMDAYGTMGVGREALFNACHKAWDAMKELQKGAVIAEATEEEKKQQSTDGRLMIGLVGHPNVGKSSLVNSFFGGKVVSVKATPGHTKTLQTLILDERTCLCDSPGVVFPRLEVPREVQIVGMLIPIAQVREPFSAIRWAMEHARKPLPELLGVKRPTLKQVEEWNESGIEVLKMDSIDLDEGKPLPWSPMLLCVTYATQRNLSKSNGPDSHRAGVEILEKILDGRFPYSVPPPESWKPHEETPAAPTAEDSDADEDSDYGVDDYDYESEQENPLAREMLNKGDLVGFFGEERLGPGSRSIKSRKKQAKQIKKQAEEEAEQKAIEAVEAKKAREGRGDGDLEGEEDEDNNNA
mmetsp:Transcript_8662/g.18909  ORF Transcript_8662/g.18909 Transcript_8662/m.18909 type:complete len:610 (-) Transcript_8662:545-2374(-)